MRLVIIYTTLRNLLSRKSNIIGLLTYLILIGVVWYMYNLRVLLYLSLFFVCILTLSTFLSELWIVIKNRFTVPYRDIGLSFIMMLFTLPLSFVYLDRQIISYILMLSFIIAILATFAANSRGL